MAILNAVVAVATSIVTSRPVRAFGIRLAFAALRKLAEKTDNTLDDEAVTVLETAVYTRPDR